jgi:hypothetical protein
MRPGSKVRYWTGAREGIGRVGRIRSTGWDGQGKPVVHIHGYSGGVAVSHVDLIEDGPERHEVPVVPEGTPYPVNGWFDSDSAEYSAGSVDSPPPSDGGGSFDGGVSGSFDGGSCGGGE